MQEKMGKNLVYTHEDGMNYNLIKNDIIVGSCLQAPADVDTCVPSSTRPCIPRFSICKCACSRLSTCVTSHRKCAD